MSPFRLLHLDDIDPNWDRQPNPRWRLGAALDTPGGMTVPVDEIFVHHTVSPDTGDVAADVAGPCDTDQHNFGKLSYSWNIHLSTRTVIEIEGTHRGAHTINNAQQSLNGISFGFGVIGNFHSSQPIPAPRAPSDDDVAFIAETILEIAVKPGLAKPGAPIKGHRDAPYATACCGDLLYARLPDIRRLVAAPPAQEAEDMQWLIKLADDPAIWITDFKTRRQVNSKKEYDDLVYLHGVSGGRMFFTPEPGASAGADFPLVRVLAAGTKWFDAVPVAA